jgi:uncharacterized protein (DUF1778 family)
MATLSKTSLEKTRKRPSKTKVSLRTALYTKPVQLRLAPEGYDLIQQAATLRGMSTSEYARDVLEENAKRTLSEHLVLKLAGDNARRFADVVLKTTSPSKTLKRSFQDFPAFDVKRK